MSFKRLRAVAATLLAYSLVACSGSLNPGSDAQSSASSISSAGPVVPAARPASHRKKGQALPIIANATWSAPASAATTRALGVVEWGAFGQPGFNGTQTVRIVGVNANGVIIYGMAFTANTDHSLYVSTSDRGNFYVSPQGVETQYHGAPGLGTYVDAIDSDTGIQRPDKPTGGRQAMSATSCLAAYTGLMGMITKFSLGGELDAGDWILMASAILAYISECGDSWGGGGGGGSSEPSKCYVDGIDIDCSQLFYAY